MTVFAKNTTYGLETSVKELQDYLDEELANYWSGELEVYGLVRKLEKDGNIYPETYLGLGAGQKEYGEIFINDKVAGTIGFLVQDRELFPFRQANIDVIFTLRIDRIYPNSTTRDIEKVLLEAEKVIENYVAIDNILDIKTGISEVFSDFDTSFIKHRDMHPWFVFSLNIEIPYSDNACQ